MASVRVSKTTYQIVSTGGNDDNLTINVEIDRSNQALEGVTEMQMLQFIKGYLATLTPNPVTITKVETVETSGL